MADAPEGSELFLVEVRDVHLGFLPHEFAGLHEGGSAVRSQDGFSVSPHSSEGAMSTHEAPSSVGLLRATMAPPPIDAQPFSVGRFHFQTPQRTRGSRAFCVCQGAV